MAIAAEPSEDALDDPATGLDDEALLAFQRQTISSLSAETLATASSTLPGGVGGVGPDQLESREAPAQAVEHERAPSLSCRPVE